MVVDMRCTLPSTVREVVLCVCWGRERERRGNAVVCIPNRHISEVCSVSRRAATLAFTLRYYFKKQHGISPYVVGVASADPKKKSDWIEKHIKKGYTTIYFADDSSKNIRAVDALKTKYPGVKIKTKLVK